MTDKLNALQGFQTGFSIGDALQQRQMQQRQLDLSENKLQLEQELQNRKLQQQEALRRVSMEAFNNPQALKTVYSLDRELGESIAKERDKYNRITSTIISDVLSTRPENQQQVWEMNKARLEQRGIDTSDLPQKFSPETAKMLKGKQNEIRTWDDTLTALDTSRGIMLKSDRTGEITPTGLMPYDPLSARVSAAEFGDKRLKESRELDDKEQGNQQVADIGERMKELYKDLDNSKAIVNKDRGVLSNLKARFQSGPWTGQVIGGAVGTEEQSKRDEIKRLKQSAKIAIMKATGLSSKAFDSNIEAKGLLDSLGDPSSDYDSSVNAVNNFIDMYGTKNSRDKTILIDNRNSGGSKTRNNQTKGDINKKEYLTDKYKLD